MREAETEIYRQTDRAEHQRGRDRNIKIQTNRQTDRHTETYYQRCRDRNIEIQTDIQKQSIREVDTEI